MYAWCERRGGEGREGERGRREREKERRGEREEGGGREGGREGETLTKRCTRRWSIRGTFDTSETPGLVSNGLCPAKGTATVAWRRAKG